MFDPHRDPCPAVGSHASRHARVLALTGLQQLFAGLALRCPVPGSMALGRFRSVSPP